MTSNNDGNTDDIVLKPKSILHYVSESEERLWNKGGISEDNENLLSDQSCDLGNKIIRHGRAVKMIHDYFGKLEPRKCCMSLATCKTSFNNVRLVRNDGRDSGIEEGAMMKTPVDHIVPVLELDDVEFRVFRYAFMCASFPVLGAPEPPSAMSPSPTSPTDQGVRFQFTGILSVSRPNTPYSLQDSGVEEQDETSIVPAETLYELLRRAFRLSTDKFYQYEQYICEKCGRRAPQKILAEELVGQLAALENNSNPFYNPHDFLMRQGYDMWHRHQFNHIADLMKKFWHSSYPPPMMSYIRHLQNVHNDYRLLMEKLIRYESPYRHGDELHPSGPTSPLSSASQRLLKEFGLRYGIGEIYRKIVYLSYLAHHFDPTVWFILHTCAVLASILDLLPSVVLVRKEHEILKDCIDTLESRASSTLCKMKSVFPGNRPSDGIESLIDLINKTLHAGACISLRKQECLKNYLLVQIQTIFPTCYTEHKMVVMTEMKQTQTELNPSLLNMMIGKVRDEVQDYKTNYQSTFERYFNIVEVAAQSLYSLLMDDVIRLCQSRQEKSRSMQINRLMLGLGFRLNQLDMDWSVYIPTEAQIWREWFLKEEIHWTTVLKIRMQEMVVIAVENDKYKTEDVHDAGPISQTSSVSSRRDRSVSTKSFTPSLNSAFSSLMSSYQSTPVHYNQMSVSSDCGSRPYPTIPESAGSDHVTPHANTFQNIKKGDQDLFEKQNPFSKKIEIPENHLVFSGRKNSYDGETKSLLEFDAEEVEPLVQVRHVNSLPDMLSKSYDHHLTPSRSFINQLKSLDTNQDTKSSENLIPNHTESDATKELNSEIRKDLIYTKSDGVNISGQIENKDSVNLIDKVVMAENCDDHEDKDSLAGEFSDGSGTITDNDELVSERSESPDENFNFPPMSEVKIMDNKPLDFSSLASDQKNIFPNENSEMESSEPVKPFSAFSVPVKQELNPVSLKVLPPYVRTFSNESQSKDSSSSKPTNSKSPTFRLNITAILPLSGSVIDLIVILQRLVGIGNIFCQTFCPLTSCGTNAGFEASTSSNYSTEMTSDLAAKQSRQKLYESLFDGLCNTLTLYADNMLCMDLCGTTKSVAVKLAGPQLLEHLDVQRSSSLIWGCRHDVDDVKDCFRYINRKTDLLCDRHEPITKEMCTRINNVSVLVDYLDVYHRKLTNSFEVCSDQRILRPSSRNMHVTISTPTDDPDRSEFEYVRGFEYDAEQDRNITMETSSQKSSGESSRSSKSIILQCQTDVCQRHLLAVLRAQSRILAYRVNLFVRDALRILLTFKDTNTPISICLRPLTQFLQSYMDCFNKWLYSDCFRRISECLWIFIVQDFEEELIRLQRTDVRVEEQSKLLIQALSHLIQFMNNQEKGIKRSLLLLQAEDVMFKLQLHATPTPQLIILYKSLLDYYWDSDNTSLHSYEDLMQRLMYKMRDELQQYRKCFTGAQLVKWIMQNQDLFTRFDRDSYVRNAGSKQDKCVAIANQLLYTGVIVDVDAEVSQNESFGDGSLLSSLDEYPELVIHSNLVSTSEMSDNDSTPRASPVPHERKQYPPISKESLTLSSSRGNPARSTPLLRGSGSRSTPVNRSITPIIAGNRSSFISSRNKNFRHSVEPGEHDIIDSRHDDGELHQKRPSSVNIEKQRSLAASLDGKRPSSVSIDRQISGTSGAIGHTSITSERYQSYSFGMDGQRPASAASSFIMSAMQYMEGESQFEDSHSKFYHIATYAETSTHVKPSPHSNRDAQEINTLVDECFQKKIMPDFIISVLYMRRKYDLDSRLFLQRQPDLVIEKLQHDMDSPRNTCDIS